MCTYVTFRPASVTLSVSLHWSHAPIFSSRDVDTKTSRCDRTVGNGRISKLLQTQWLILQFVCPLSSRFIFKNLKIWKILLFVCFFLFLELYNRILIFNLNFKIITGVGRSFGEAAWNGPVAHLETRLVQQRQWKRRTTVGRSLFDGQKGHPSVTQTQADHRPRKHRGIFIYFLRILHTCLVSSIQHFEG